MSVCAIKKLDSEKAKIKDYISFKSLHGQCHLLTSVYITKTFLTALKLLDFLF